MKPAAICTLLDIADSTLRKYAHDYADYLTPSATGGNGRHRDYSDQDAQVIKLIHEMKRAKQPDGDIDATLSSLRASDWQRLPALDNAASAIIHAPAATIAAKTETAVLQREIEILREFLSDRDRLLAAAINDRDELLSRLHRAETLVELYEQGRITPPIQK